MKTTFLSLGLALLSSVALLADSVIVQSVEGAGQSGQMTVKVKGNKILTEISPQVSMLTDVSTGTVATLMHTEKVYMEMNADVTRQLLKTMQAQAGTPSAEAPVLKATGKREKINGHDTEIFVVQNGALKSTYWIARDYPDGEKILGLYKQMHSSSMSEMARQLAPQPSELPGVPVKTEIEMAPGQKVTTTLISVKEQPLDDSVFAIPADYKALPTPAFGAPGAQQ